MAIPLYKLTQANTALNKIKKNKNNTEVLIGILTLANLFMSATESRREARKKKRDDIKPNNTQLSIEDILNIDKE